MTRIARELFLFLILVRIALQTCASVNEMTESSSSLGSLKAKSRNESERRCLDEQEQVDDGNEDIEGLYDHEFDIEVLRRIGSGESLEDLDEVDKLIEGEEERPSLTDVTTMEGSASTLARSRKYSVDDLDVVRSKFCIHGSYGKATVEDEENQELTEDNYEDFAPFVMSKNRPVLADMDIIQSFLTPSVISETCSVASDWEQAEPDLFDGWPVDKVSMNWIINTLIPALKSGQKLSLATQLEILEYARDYFFGEKTIVKIGIDFNEILIVVGDIHGQFDDLIRIFEQHGQPCYGRKFIFNGDIVDRGPKSIECLLTLLLMKVCAPACIFITRGNHESHTCGPGTFREECFERTEDPLRFFSACHDVFNVLPLGYIIQDKFFVCHGGLPEDFDLDALKNANKPEYTFYEQGLGMSLLWNDPHEGFGMKPSLRGGSTLSFGRDITQKFLLRHGFSLLIRSHEYHKDGFFYSHGKQCLTIFSAPNYCGLDNQGTVMRIRSDLRFDVIRIEVPEKEQEPVEGLRRSKERSMTLNLEDVEFVFPVREISDPQDSKDTGDIENQIVPEAVGSEQSLSLGEDEDTSSLSSLFPFVAELFSIKLS